MRKFIISFEFDCTLFSAKVMVKRNEGNSIFSITVMNGKTEFSAEGVFLFMPSKKGCTLGLLTRDGKIQELKWRVEMEYVDKSETIPFDRFCNS